VCTWGGRDFVKAARMLRERKNNRANKLCIGNKCQEGRGGFVYTLMTRVKEVDGTPDWDIAGGTGKKKLGGDRGGGGEKIRGCPRYVVCTIVGRPELSLGGKKSQKGKRSYRSVNAEGGGGIREVGTEVQGRG